MTTRTLHTLGLLVVLALALGGCSTNPETQKRDYLAKGDKYFDKGSFREASIMYQKALQKDMRFGQAYYKLGLSQLKLGRVGEGASALRRAVELQPDNVDAHGKLADVYLGAYMTDPRKFKNLSTELSDIAQKLIKKDANSYQGLRIEAYLALAQGKLKEAIEQFRHADKAKPLESDLTLALSQALLADGQQEEGESLVRKLLAKDDTYGPAYDVLYLNFMRAKRLDEAEKVLSDKVAKNPKSAQFVVQLAGHYYGVNKQKEMKDTLAKLTGNAADFPLGNQTVGDFYFRIRNYDLALANYEEGLKKNPKQKTMFQKRQIETLTAMGKPAEALTLVEGILKADDKDSEAVAMRAGLWLAAGRREQVQAAINDLQSVVSKMPDNFVLRYNLGRALMMKGDLDAAKVQFMESVKLRPDYLPPRLAITQIQLQKAEYPAAMQSADEVLAVQPGNIPARLFRTTTLIATKEYGQAKKEVEDILKSSPNNNDAKFQAGMIAFNQSDFKTAEAVFRGLMVATPPDPRGLLAVTETYMAMLRYDEAMKVVSEEIRKNPDRLDMHVALGNIAVRANHYDQALKSYQLVVAKRPDIADVYVKIAEVCRLQGDVACAEQNFRKAKDLAPNNPDAFLRLAMLYETNGRKNDARPIYDQILRIMPDNFVALNNLAYILAEEGKDLDQALTYAQRARQRMPNEPDVADTLGWIYIKKNLGQSAVQIYKDLVLRPDARSSWHYHLALALFQQGDKPQARKQCELALAKKPEAAEAAKIKELIAKI